MAKFPVSLKARLILIADEKVLLLKQTKPNGGNYTLVGGTIEQSEFAKACIIRESKEEAGIILSKNNLDLVHVLHKRSKSEHRIVLYFKATIFSGAPRSLEPDKFKGVSWFSMNELPDKLTNTVRQILKAYRTNEFYSELEK
jgi:8-oxo-dGTP diphosphatase